MAGNACFHRVIVGLTGDNLGKELGTEPSPCHTILSDGLLSLNIHPQLTRVAYLTVSKWHFLGT